MAQEKITYNWTLKDAVFTKDKGKVFSCFACGGGSTMGYKLAGFDVIGCNEIDKRIFDVYVANHHPKYAYNEDIRDFVKREELPDELYQLDILDGSPPCSSFSTSGNREKDWGKAKKFKEGQKLQVLDTLFFDFIALAKRLQPKVVIAENVKGLLLGAAKDYVRKIYEAFEDAGYYCQHFLLDAAQMGVPQRRERVFFICLRKDLASPFLRSVNLYDLRPEIDMNFSEKPIMFGEVADYKGCEIKKSTKTRELWDNKLASDKDLADTCQRIYGKRSFFNYLFYEEESIAPTIVSAGHNSMILRSKPLYLSVTELISVSSFPKDYKATAGEIGYVCGMSVPPIMMHRIASRVYEQWLSKIK